MKWSASSDSVPSIVVVGKSQPDVVAVVASPLGGHSCGL